jgi:hypothetical protein
MKAAYLALGLALPILAGCVATTPEPADACGAGAYRYLVGQPGVLLDGMRFAQEVRVIQPGTPVTMDFRADRLNFRLDARDVIREVTCG